MSRAWLLPPHYRKNSLFTTTFRNVLGYWILNLIIFPAYFVCFYQIIAYISDIPGVNTSIAQVTAWCVASIPVCATVIAPRHYHRVTKRRFAVAVVSEIILIIWLIYLGIPQFGIALFLSIMLAWLSIFAFVIAPRQTKKYFLHIIFLVIFIIFTDWFLKIGVIEYFYTQISTNVSNPNNPLYPYIGITGLTFLLVVAGPIRFFRRHFAYWLYIVRNIRYDIIQARYSPLVGLTNWYNILIRQWLPAIFDLNNRRLYVTILMIIGLIISFTQLLITSYDLSIIFNQDNMTNNNANTSVEPTSSITIAMPFSTLTINAAEENSGDKVESQPYFLEVIFGDEFDETFIAGLSLGIIFVSLYLIYYTLSNRSRYIVSQFVVDENSEKQDKSPELRAVATLATSLLTDEMQRIAVLLRMRQVENVYFSPDDNNAFFVTTGVDDKFINQLQQIVSVDTPQGKFNLGALYAVLMRRLSDIHIEGRVQRRTNGNIEIWVHITYGKNGSLAIEQRLVPENTIIEIDEHSLRPIARMMAIKLFIEMGQVTHLSSTPESFSDLLMGLEASANRNWWQSISYYRRTLNAEETLRGLYGLGHYQLGAALTYQGDWQQGLEHLHTAEQDGPLIPEIRYMLALSLLYLYWDRLDQRRNVFNQIETHLHAAMELRPGFAEAHQLLATAYYRRGRQIEVSLTRHRRKPEDDKKRSKDEEKQLNAHQEYNYQTAVNCLRKAIRLYDERERQQLDVPNLYSNTQNTSENLIQQRMTATHQLGDALRGLKRYIEAETYYQTVHVIYPRNLRNLNDLTKTLCLSENWQRAEEFLWRDVFIHDVAWWDADSCFHMAWTLFGGLLESKRTFANNPENWSGRIRLLFRKSFKIIRAHVISSQRLNFKTLANSLESIHADSRMILHDMSKSWYGYTTADEQFLAKYPIFQYSEALKYLDFALHQRPRYITSWDQTDWVTPFIESATHFKITLPKKTDKALLEQMLDSIIDKPMMIELLNVEEEEGKSEQLEEWIETTKELKTSLDRASEIMADITSQQSNPSELFIRLENIECNIKQAKSISESSLDTDTTKNVKIYKKLKILLRSLIILSDESVFSINKNNVIYRLAHISKYLANTIEQFEELQKDLESEYNVSKERIEHAKYQENHLHDDDIKRLAQRNLLWIALHIASYDLPANYKEQASNSNKPTEFLYDLEQFAGWKDAVEKAIEYMNKDEDDNGFKPVYENLKANRQHVLNYVKTFQNSPRSTGLVWQYARLSLAQMLFKDWCEMQKPLSRLNARISDGCDNPSKYSDGPTFRDRWELEIYAETTLLTARILAEAGCYELLLLVTIQACNIFKDWSIWWVKCYPSHHQDSSMAYRHLTFSPRITRYHHASLRAWKAYALHQCVFDKMTTQRCLSDDVLNRILPTQAHTSDDSTRKVMTTLYKETKKYITHLYVLQQSGTGETQTQTAEEPYRFDRDRVLNKMQEYIKDARKDIHEHPLSMYVQALIHQKCEIYSQAIEEYERLIDLISPYDPKRQIGFENLPKGDYQPDNPLTETSLRARMYYMERVTGRQQFYGIVSLPHIHEQIASCYSQTHNPELRVKHLLEAIRQSPNSDSDVDNFLRMAYQLNQMERYKEAASILEAVLDPLQKLGNAKLSESLYQKPNVLSAIVKTRSKDYAESMNYGRKSAYNLKLEVKLPSPNTLEAQRVVWRFIASLKFQNNDNDAIIKAIIYQFIKSFGGVEQTLGNFDPSKVVSNQNEHFDSTLRELRKILFTKLDKQYDDKYYKDFQDVSSSIKEFLSQDWVKFPPKVNDETPLHIFSKNNKADKNGQHVFDWDLLNAATIRSRVVLSPGDRQQFFEMLAAEKTKKNGLDSQFGLVMQVHMGMFLSLEYSNKLSQFAEICNSLAYNRAETGLGLHHAYNDSAVAIGVMFYLLHSAPKGSTVRTSFERKLAQFFDTFGWVRYRHFHANMVRINPINIKDTTEPTSAQSDGENSETKVSITAPQYDIERLKIAEEFLQRGLRYDRQRAIIHYHLARLYLTRVEALWQRFPQIEGDDVYGLAALIDTSITQSFRYLRNAREFDRFQRLHTQLSWLNNRLQMYKIAWEKRQFRGIAGDRTADSPLFRQGGVFSSAD